MEEYKQKYEDNYLSYARENRLKHFEPEFHKDLVRFINIYFKEIGIKRFNAKIYLFLNQITKVPVCKHYKKKQTKFKQYSYGYFDYCSTKCSSNSPEKKEKIEETCLEKYGHRNIAQGTVKKKMVLSCLSGKIMSPSINIVKGVIILGF